MQIARNRIHVAVTALIVAAAARAQVVSDPSREERVEQLDRALDEMAEAGFSGAVLVACGDDVLLDRACGLADRAHGRVNAPDTIFDIGSVTKQFTATAILQLQERKQLSIHDSIERYFDKVPEEKREIQLHHLLTHTSGLPYDVPVGSATIERDELIRAAMAARMQSKPGSEFVYNNCGYMLLGAIVEIVSGERYEDYVRKHLFEPAGLTSSGFLRTEGVDPARTACGYEGNAAYGRAERGWYSWGLRGCGGALSTTGDLLRWSKALQGDRVLSKDSREQLFTPFLLGYAYGWWVRQDPVYGKVVSHSGTTRGFEASLAHSSEGDLRVIVLCNDRGRSDATAARLSAVALGRQAIEATVTLPPAQLESLAGDYELSPGGTIRVRADGDALELEPSREAVISLVAGTTKLQKDRELELRAEQLCDALAAGDAGAAQLLMSKEWPGWSQQMVRAWSGWLGTRGELKEKRVLGSRARALTLLELVHERRTVVWSLNWKAEVLTGWSIDGGLPEAARYRARSATKFVYTDADARSMADYVLVFEREASGAGRSLSMSHPRVQLEAKRAR